MASPTPPRVRAVINLLLSENEGERQAAMTQLYRMKTKLPRNTILSDYIAPAPAAPAPHPGQQRMIEQLRVEVARLRGQMQALDAARTTARMQAEFAAREAETLRVHLRDAKAEAARYRNETYARSSREHIPWTEAETVWLLAAYRDLCAQHGHHNKRQREEALDAMCAAFNVGDWFRTPKAIRHNLRKLRHADPTLPQLFPPTRGAPPPAGTGPVR